MLWNNYQGGMFQKFFGNQNQGNPAGSWQNVGNGSNIGGVSGMKLRSRFNWDDPDPHQGQVWQPSMSQDEWEAFKAENGYGTGGERTAEKGQLQENWEDIAAGDTSGDWSDIFAEAWDSVKDFPDKHKLQGHDLEFWKGYSAQQQADSLYNAWLKANDPNYETQIGGIGSGGLHDNQYKGWSPEQLKKAYLAQQAEADKYLNHWKAAYNKKQNIYENAELAAAKAEKGELNAKRFQLLKIGAGLEGRGATGEERRGKRQGISGLTVGLSGSGLSIPGN
jgi:hypothetical protein